MALRRAGFSSGPPLQGRRPLFERDGRSGRFTQEDPLGLGGGLNLYGYASGGPGIPVQADVVSASVRAGTDARAGSAPPYQRLRRRWRRIPPGPCMLRARRATSAVGCADLATR